MERPNTVAGLIEKRRTLAARLKIIEAERQALIVDMNALDTVLRLFAPEIDGRTLKAKRIPSPFYAAKNELQCLIRDTIRETDGPITSLMVAERFCKLRGMPDDDRTLQTMRNRISTMLTKLQRAGVVRHAAEKVGQYKGWELAGGE